MPKRICTIGLMVCLGCTTNPGVREGKSTPRPIAVPIESTLVETERDKPAGEPVAPVAWSGPLASTDQREDFSLVDYILSDDPLPGSELSPAELSKAELPKAELPKAEPAESDGGSIQPRGVEAESAAEVSPGDAEAIQLNLPSVLAMVGGEHPLVGAARWRVREAYAQLAQAETMWLPSIQAGFSFHRRDGNYQASNGAIVDVNRNSFQYGLGMGATGAGTTPRPGLVAQFHLADAIFQPRIARTTAWARGHAAGATLNRQLLSAAIAYNHLVAAHQDRSILQASKTRTDELAKITRDFAETGQGLQADADRMQTELALIEGRLIAAREEIDVRSARLAQAISLDGGGPIIPLDAAAVPLEWDVPEAQVSSLIATGLGQRPELKESQALVAAACEAFRREKYAPFVPSVLLGFSAGGFGGGVGSELDDIDGRYDLDALMSWQIRNLGLGEHAAQREQTARVQQAKFQRVAVMDQVAREVSESHARVQSRRRQIAVSRQAIEFATRSYQRNLARIRDGEGLPIEVLQSMQALEQAQRAYLRSVVRYNQAQLELQWAQGWPVQTP